jgi:hypothetical protein
LIASALIQLIWAINAQLRIESTALPAGNVCDAYMPQPQFVKTFAPTGGACCAPQRKGLVFDGPRLYFKVFQLAASCLTISKAIDQNECAGTRRAPQI